MGWVFGYPVALNQLQELPALAPCLYAGSATDPPIALALKKIRYLCSSEHVTADVRQELVDLAKAVQCDHLESRWCQYTAGKILTKLTSRQGATTIHRQHSTSAEQGTSQRQRAAMAFWLFHAPRWFPDLHNKTYFIPPLDPDSNQNGGDTTAGIVQRSLTPTSCSCPSRDPCNLDLQNRDFDQSSGDQTPQITTGGSHEPPPHSETDPSPPVKRQKLISTPVDVAYKSSFPCRFFNSQSVHAQTTATSAMKGPFQTHFPSTSQQVTDVTSAEDIRHHLLRCFRALAERQQEVMMVIWRLDFRRYLDRQDNPLDAATTAFLTRSATGRTGNGEGGFMMLIHQKYGLIVARVTLVGRCMADVQDEKEKLADTVTEAVKELNAAGRLLTHMTSALQHVKVTKVIILPCITSGQMAHALGDNQDVQQVRKLGL
ncbi:hypothetical protein BaRGS_00030126 [Batillaria attramentaria]|uniref:Uncharacterized protein n=1 Tax=Batillaria attramentaria TaxID=370345 RepID=A0ABD0JVR8_9CAEN